MRLKKYHLEHFKLQMKFKLFLLRPLHSSSYTDVTLNLKHLKLHNPGNVHTV